MASNGSRLVVLLAGVVCLTLTGCGDDPVRRSSTPAAQAEQSTPSVTAAPSEAAGTGGDSGPGAAGAPDPGGGGAPGAPRPTKATKKALGAPIKIPARLNDQGKPLDQMLSSIRNGIRQQCGGTLCVHVRVEYSEEGYRRCEFQRTRPPQGSTVRRGSTVVVVAGTEACDPPPDSSSPSPSDSPSASASASASTEDSGSSP